MMKTKLMMLAAAAAIVLSLGMVGCKGTNNPEDPTQETTDAKLISRNGMEYEIEMKDGTRLYFLLTRDYTDTPEYFSLISAESFYSRHSQAAEMIEKYAYSGILTVPASVRVDMGGGKYETHSVEGIHKDGCRGMSKLSGIILPNSIRAIGEMAFAECSALETISIPEGITELHSTFYNCQSLKEIKLPESLVVFSSAVDNCPLIQTIVLPNKLATLGIHRCAAFNSINLPSSLTILHISDCPMLDKVELPNAIKDIILYDNTALETLSIPQSAEVVGLCGCVGLKKVRCYGVNPPRYGGLMDYHKYNLYVPKESISKYQADEDGWAFHALQILPLEDYDNPDTPDNPDDPSDCNNIQASYLPIGASGLGDMKEQLVSGAKSWFYDEKYGARVSKSNTEAWLYTPTYDMSGMASVQVSFEHAINYAGDMQTQQTMWVTDDFTGDVTTTSWQQVTIPNYPAGNNWTFVSNTVNIPIQYVGEKTVVAFKYTSGGSGNTATWEVKNLTINAVCANN